MVCPSQRRTDGGDSILAASLNNEKPPDDDDDACGRTAAREHQGASSAEPNHCNIGARHGHPSCVTLVRTPAKLASWERATFNYCRVL